MRIFSSGLGEDVRPELADRVQPVVPALELVARGQRVGLFVLERGDLESEEQELRIDGRALLRQARDERSPRRFVLVGRVPEVRVVDRARERRLDPLALLDRLAQLAGAQLRDRP